MKSEALNINDKTFLINRLIQQAPTTTLVREFFKNAEENAALAPLGKRKIKIYPVEIGGVNKLAFWNTGIGMNEEELRRATDISSSINKEMSLDGNFGIGAKVSGLTMSGAGIRYRSCKDGCVHEVTIGYDEELQTYARFAMELGDGTSATVFDITAVIESEGGPLDYDWTEVILFGESDDHNTVERPIGSNKKVDRSFIPTSIFRRFAEFSEGIEVSIDVAMTKGGGKDETGRSRQLKTLNQVLDRLPMHELVSDDDLGIQVRYIHDPKHEKSSHSLSARANPATGSTTFCAVVFKGERYDFKTQKAWSSAAPNFGIPFGSKVLSVEIIIPDTMAMPNQYRDALTWPHDRAPLTADDFSDFVREMMPDWVKEIIKSESPEAPDNLDDLQKDLQRLLDEFRVPTTAMRSAKLPDADKTNADQIGDDTTDQSQFPIGGPLSDIEAALADGERSEHAGQRARQKKVRKAPEGAKATKASKALERVPEIKILTDPEEINEKSLKGRAGRYYKDAQTLFINGLYPVVDRLAYELERELSGGDADPNIIRESALTASRRSVAFRVGKAACYAISKRLSDDWSADDLDTATSPESLSMAADDYKQSISDAKRFAKQLIKASALRETAA